MSDGVSELHSKVFYLRVLRLYNGEMFCSGSKDILGTARKIDV